MSAKDKEKKAKAIEKQRQSAIRSMERQRAKQREKQNCPKHRQEQIDKQIANQERANARRIEKEKTPEYKAKLIEKQKAAAEKLKAKPLKVKALKRTPIKIKPPKIKKRKFNVSTSKPIQRKPLKSKGLGGRLRKPWEISLHDQMGQIGCICCLNKGLIAEGDTYVSIHHTKGRVSAIAHEHCLPLCTYHHDQPLPQEIQSQYPDVFPIHAKGTIGGKTPWEKVNGKQDELVRQVWELIGYIPKNSDDKKQLKTA